jgi:hypothetical protein
MNVYKSLIFISFFLILFVFFVSPFLVKAQFENSPIQSRDDVINAFNNFATWFRNLAGLASIVVLLYAGYLFMVSGGILVTDEKKGDPESLRRAKGLLKWGLIGIALVILSEAIVRIISSFIIN